MSTIIQDFRRALRRLARAPGFTAIAVLAFALGIGANTAVFSVVNAVLLEPLPFAEPDRLVVLREQERGTGRPPEETSAATFEDWRAQSRSFEALAAWLIYGYALTGEGRPEDIFAVRASASLFSLLGVEPILGRTFLPEEEQLGNHRVTLLSYSLWQRRFGADPGIVGRSITLDGEPYTVVGVMPRGFLFPDFDDIGLWTPLAYFPDELRSRQQRMFFVIGRLARGVTLESAQAEMHAIARRLAARYPEAHEGWDTLVRPAKEVVIADARPALLVLLGAVAFVLLIACANVASLLLARAADRRRELALHRVLGAGRWRITRSLLAESLLTALLGGGVGLLVAVWGVDLIVALDPAHLPHWNEIGIDGGVLAFTAVVAVLTAVLSGAVPAWSAARVGMGEALTEAGSRTTAGVGSARLRHGMIVAEVALSIVLLVGAGLLIRSFQRLSQVDPGFNADGVLTAAIFLPPTGYPEDEQQIQFFDALRRRLERLPGVLAAGGVTTLPMNPVGIDHDMPFRVPGTPSALAERLPQADFRIATEGYLRAMGIPLLRGRDFNSSDRAGTPCVTIVNRTFVERFLPAGEDPLARSVVVGGEAGDDVCQIIGVAGDVRHRGLDAVPRPEFYVAFRQMYSYGTLTFAIRSAGNPAALVPAVRSAVFALDPTLPISAIATVPELVADSVAERRFRMILLGGFAALALLLAASGIYGVLSYSVAQRTREIGIRMALGAREGNVVRAIMRQGLRTAAIGIAIGLGASLLLTRSMASLLYDVRPTDPVTLAAVSLLLLAVAVLACVLPAWRATNVDPVTALRRE